MVEDVMDLISSLFFFSYDKIRLQKGW